MVSKRSLFSFICQFLWVSSVLAQQKIKGAVINAATKEPIAGSSVFLNNTSIGTATDKNGHFELSNVPGGRQELIVSSIGYTTYALAFNSTELPMNVTVELAVKMKELDNVIVEPFEEGGWDKWGGLFTQNFIGTTPRAKYCKIKNYKAIRFRLYKKSNRLVAFSDEPLVIENKALGYNIIYQLEDFEISFKARTSVYAGYPFFEEIDKSRKGLLNRWQNARDKAYYGSMTHFMRSLYTDSLIQSGYEVRRMKRTRNYEKDRVRKIYNPSGVISDSNSYYERILRQRDEIDTYGRQILPADSLIVGANDQYKYLYFTDYLFITYKKEMEESDYITSGPFPENRKPGFQNSYIYLVEPEAISIDVNGNYFSPRNIITSSYWGWSEKIADMLPIDYEPRGNKE
jgi:hypothetical protein